MKKTAAILVRTFLFGGFIGIIGHALMQLYETLGFNSLFTAMAMLLTLGIAGCLAYTGGLYDRFEKVGGAAAFLPFSGLGVAMAETQKGARDDGKTFKQAMCDTWLSFFKATGIGIAFSIATGIIASLI